MLEHSILFNGIKFLELKKFSKANKFYNIFLINHFIEKNNIFLTYFKFKLQYFLVDL
jgi:hypothetical protein